MRARQRISISELSALKSSTTELRFADKNFKEAQHRREQFEAEHDMESILSPAECPYTIDELNNLIAEVENSMDEVRTSITPVYTPDGGSSGAA